MNTFYSTFDVEKYLGIKRTRLQEWMNLKFVRPSQASPGQGQKALFSIEDLYGIRLFKELLSFGLNRKIASDIAYWVLGFPMQIQEKSADWGQDFLNIYAYYKTENSTELSYLYDYGPKGEVHPESNILISMVVELKKIKDLVDKELD